MADAAAESETADTGARNHSSGCRQSVQLGGSVEVLPGGASTRERPPRINVNLNVVHLRKVDDDPVVTGGKSGNAVRAATYRDRPLFTPGKTDCPHHIFG